MTSLRDLRKQRDNLDIEIAQREAEESLTWDNWLYEVRAGVQNFANSRGYPITYRVRKNVETATIGLGENQVHVDLGYDDHARDDWNISFGIRTQSGITFSVTGGMPPV